jgi:hypothetical protein
VLFAAFNETIFDGFMEQARGNKTSVEVVMNHRHILDVFQNAANDPSEEVILFPSRTVVVSSPENDVEDLLDYEITFFQERTSGEHGAGRA